MDLFMQSKKSPNTYPLNLVRTEVYTHRLNSYAARLKDDRYFHVSHRDLFMWDLEDTSQGGLPPLLHL